MTTYSGLCVGGPFDGQMYESMSGWIRVPLKPDASAVYSPDECVELDEMEYLHLNLGEGSDGSPTCIWIPNGTTPVDALREMMIGYAESRT